MIQHRPLDPATKATIRPEGRSIPFKAGWSTTSDLLQSEADHLTGRRRSTVYIEVDLPASAIRLDGGIYANAKAPTTPVVAVAIPDTPLGDLRWVSAKYGSSYNVGRGWQANVRAVALTLKALRDVERWGAAAGEQYRGFAAIGATSSGTALGSGLTRDDAAALLWRAADAGQPPALSNLTPDDVASAYRMAARRTHPDSGGDPALFARITEARDLLIGANR